jgi:hypothetical protein
LRPNAAVLIRGAFPGRSAGITLVRWFPEAARVLEAYPTIEETTAAFALAGFQPAALEAVPQQTAPDLRTFAGQLRREADTLLRALSDTEFAGGMDRLRAAAASQAAGSQPPAPVVDRLDLLVLR